MEEKVNWVEISIKECDSNGVSCARTPSEHKRLFDAREQTLVKARAFATHGSLHFPRLSKSTESSLTNGLLHC
jgi:hypothetical protein